MTVNLDEGQRQMLLLALAELALSRPGWDHSIREIASRFSGLEMYESFKLSNADRVRESRGPVGPR
jgi:hypothetical protein